MSHKNLFFQLLTLLIFIIGLSSCYPPCEGCPPVTVEWVSPQTPEIICYSDTGSILGLKQNGFQSTTFIFNGKEAIMLGQDGDLRQIDDDQVANNVFVQIIGEEELPDTEDPFNVIFTWDIHFGQNMPKNGELEIIASNLAGELSEPLMIKFQVITPRDITYHIARFDDQLVASCEETETVEPNIADLVLELHDRGDISESFCTITGHELIDLGYEINFEQYDECGDNKLHMLSLNRVPAGTIIRVYDDSMCRDFVDDWTEIIINLSHYAPVAILISDFERDDHSQPEYAVDYKTDGNLNGEISCLQVTPP